MEEEMKNTLIPIPKENDIKSFTCNTCLYNTCNKFKYEKHCLTAKHIRMQQVEKSSSGYECAACRYNTEHKARYDKHIQTAKHIKKMNSLVQQQQAIQQAIQQAKEEVKEEAKEEAEEEVKEEAEEEAKEEVKEEFKQKNTKLNENFVVKKNNFILTTTQNQHQEQSTNNQLATNSSHVYDNNVVNNKYIVNVYINNELRESVNINELLQSIQDRDHEKKGIPKTPIVVPDIDKIMQLMNLYAMIVTFDPSDYM